MNSRSFATIEPRPNFYVGPVGSLEIFHVRLIASLKMLQKPGSEIYPHFIYSAFPALMKGDLSSEQPQPPGQIGILAHS